MQVKRTEDNAMFTMISVAPWNDQPWAQDITVLQEKRDTKTGQEINQIHLRYGSGWIDAENALLFAQAILRAVDIARQLERDGGIVLEGE